MMIHIDLKEIDLGDRNVDGFEIVNDPELELAVRTI